jgi:DNA-binding transcriptional ArsR family regulator
MIIKDPEVAKLLADDTRRRILHMLRHKELSPADLTKALDKNYSSIQHHLTQLVAAGLVEQTREERVRNMIQPYYHATAHRYLVSYSLTENLQKDDEYAQYQETTLQKMYKGLKAFEIDTPDDRRARILELIDRCVKMEQRAFEEAIEKQIDPASLEKSVQRPLLHLLTQITLSQDPEHTTAINELATLLKPKEPQK